MIKLLRQYSGLTGKAILAVLAATMLQNLSAQEFEWAPDFPVGAAMPEISAQDQDGQVLTFTDLKGDKGLLFVFSRSFDW
ncbi:MAG: hypothetical protein ACI95C_001956 [Pseudohongiellaceae bacterium]|jgi:hypothetical protein